MPTTKSLRSYHSCFVVDKSKLTRLMEEVDKKLRQNGNCPSTKFTLFMKDNKIAIVESLDQVFTTDNSSRHPVERLAISSVAFPEGKEPERYVNIEFTGTSPEIEIYVRGDDPWVRETSSVAEEQVERTLQSSFMYRLARPVSAMSFLAASACILFALMVTLPLGSRNLQPSRLANSMWLTDHDLAELQSTQGQSQLTSEQVNEIVSRQVRNLINQESQRQQPLIRRLLHAKPLLMLVPILVILAALVYLLQYCYPQAVFNWGDAEERYDTIKKKRNVVQICILLALVVGIVGNLFVYGLSLH